MKKVYIISVLFGALIISVGILFVRMIVNNYDETGNFYVLMGAFVVIYIFGLLAAIILHPLFKDVISWIQKERNQNGNDI